MTFLLQTFNIFIDVLITLLILRVILSWFVRDYSHPLLRFLVESTEPILKPIRRSLPRLGPFDFSPIIAFFILKVLRSLINSFFL